MGNRIFYRGLGRLDLTGIIAALMAFGAAFFGLASCRIPGLPSTPKAPDSPSGVAATAWPGKIVVRWAATPGAASYNLYWAIGATVSVSSGARISGATSPYTLGGLTDGDEYAVVVTAANGAGESTPTVVEEATPEPYYLYASQPGGNTIAAFSVGSDGSLAKVSGSPFSDGTIANSSGTTADSPYGLAVNPSGSLLFAGNNATGTVSVFAIDPRDGSLSQVAGSPFSTGGSFPDSVAVSPTGEHLFAANHGTNTIAAFDVGQNGALEAVGGSPFSAGPSGTVPFCLASGPDGGSLFVANNVSNGSVLSFAVGAEGAIATPARSSASGGSGSNPWAVAVTPDGQFLYSANYATGNVTAFAIDADGELSARGSTSASSFKGAGITVSPHGAHLYTTVSGTSSNNLFGFSIGSDGSLVPVGGSPFTAGYNPGGLSMTPDGEFLYVADGSGSAPFISAFSVSANGSLSAIAGYTGSEAAGSYDVVVAHVTK